MTVDEIVTELEKLKDFVNDSVKGSLETLKAAVRALPLCQHPPEEPIQAPPPPPEPEPVPPAPPEEPFVVKTRRPYKRRHPK